ncbi:MAG: UvrD-helicase domain-containing protein [Gemmatimonadaceae bacterium]|nr:UvrD-helicase domain-containing protein [Gemmatimonadaceae bacterium]
MTTRPTVPDADARALAQTALDANLLVEAGAGSGKTTLMVDRVLALLARGTPPDQIAAVTFTRKAATELRERLAKRLEERVARATGTAEESALRTAQRQIDRAYIGTIHSFCSRLLREEALAARLAPDFVEPDPALLAVAAEEFLRAFADDARRLGTHGADRLRTLGIEPRDLVTAALTIDAQPDVAFVAHDMPCPDVALVVAALDALMTRAVALLPAGAPSGGWDRLQTFVRRWQIERDALDWTDAATVARATARIESFHAKQVILSRWIPERKAQAPITALRDDVLRFVSGELAEFLRAWRAHCYSPALRLATAASAAWRAHREANDRLTFEDLLVRTAALLRTHAVARDALGDRWRHLLVDEFQDTDPLQAEICLLLASPASEGNDWRMVTPRPGALFVVGDPKQSIYRFRRADIQTYEFVRGRFERFGHVVQLIANFRSTDAIATLVNAHFAVAFGAAPHGVGTTSPSAPAATATQAPFAPLVTACPAPPGTGVGRYDVPTARAKAAVFDADAAMVASHIAESICAGVATPDDFLILTARKSELRAYAAALALRGVPAVTAGAAGEWSDEMHCGGHGARGTLLRMHAGRPVRCARGGRDVRARRRAPCRRSAGRLGDAHAAAVVSREQ